MNDPHKALTGQTALITGASGGIGAAIALELASNGADIALHYFNNKPTELIDSIKKQGVEHHSFQADFSNQKFTTKLLDNIGDKVPSPGILINCAASQAVGNMKNITDAQFSEMINTNLNAVFALSREFARRLSPQAARTASIVNISSIEATRPAPGHGHYATSKAALEMLTKSMALEFGASGLRVNALAPGLIERKTIKSDWPEGVERWQNTCPLGRMGKPEDVAQAVSFLVSQKASFITGRVLTIDGGMSTTAGW
ncbi:MAG: SDR family oxidoreductase [Rhizobiaceae bacterium]|nr:SDR family oxidoreductase [Rhizobiaceae bacterium]